METFTWYNGGHPEMEFQLLAPTRIVNGVGQWLIGEHELTYAGRRLHQSAMNAGREVIAELGLIQIGREPSALASWYRRET